MRKKRWGSLLGFIVFCVFLLVLFKIGNAAGFLEPAGLFFQQKLANLATGILNFPKGAKEQKLLVANARLEADLAAKKALEKENSVLKKQFKYSTPHPKNLLPADVVSVRSFLPGVSIPRELILDKGTKDGVKKGAGVIAANNLVGIIKEASPYLSVVLLVTEEGFSQSVRTVGTNALGIGRGVGGGIVLDTVVLTDKLTKGDLVVTGASLTGNTLLVPANLVLGQIVSVNKQQSALFQSAEVKSLLDLSHLTTVFIFMPE